jgi:hypothetical protein
VKEGNLAEAAIWKEGDAEGKSMWREGDVEGDISLEGGLC